MSGLQSYSFSGSGILAIQKTIGEDIHCKFSKK
jgi:hypothetical protein